MKPIIVQIIRCNEFSFVTNRFYVIFVYKYNFRFRTGDSKLFLAHVALVIVGSYTMILTIFYKTGFHFKTDLIKTAKYIILV